MSDAVDKATAWDDIAKKNDIISRFRNALQNIAGDEEPRPMLNGTTAEELRNIARAALSMDAE